MRHIAMACLILNMLFFFKVIPHLRHDRPGAQQSPTLTPCPRASAPEATPLRLCISPAETGQPRLGQKPSKSVDPEPFPAPWKTGE